MKNDEHFKVEQTTSKAGELIDLNREELLKLPMKGKVQYPFKQPYDRHSLPAFLHDQTDRSAIGRYEYKGAEAWIQKKLSGREYSWSIFDEKGNKIYGEVYVDRENLGAEYAFSIFIPQIEAAIDFLNP